MKRIIVYLLFIPLPAFGQELPYNQEGSVVYERIFDFDNMDKDIIHQFSRKWIDDIFDQSSEVIQSDNQKAGEIVGVGYSESNLKHSIRLSIIPNEYIRYKFTISSRDNKARVRFYSVELTDEHLRSIPVERIDKSYRNKPNKKTVDAWVQRVGELNNVFDDLLNHYEISIPKYSNDEF